MDTIEIVVIAVFGGLALLVALAYVLSARRVRARGAAFEQHVAAADRALEEARADDRGWDRTVLEETARSALAEHRADEPYDAFYLVLVDDRPGVTEDRAHVVARGPKGEARVILTRTDAGWSAERVE